ncbi:MAG: hypothetical protein ACI4VP_03775 [Clostridia bacterium]
MCKQTLAEKVFGGVSDFRGAYGASEKKQENVPVSAEGRIPHWHDSAFDGTGVKEPPVTEERELSSHF